jgi:hypothetical protein
MEFSTELMANRDDRAVDVSDQAVAKNDVRDLLAAAHKANRLAFFGDHAALAETLAFSAFLAPLRNAEWVVYAKEPFGGPQAKPIAIKRTCCPLCQTVPSFDTVYGALAVCVSANL